MQKSTTSNEQVYQIWTYLSLFPMHEMQHKYNFSTGYNSRCYFSRYTPQHSGLIIFGIKQYRVIDPEMMSVTVKEAPRNVFIAHFPHSSPRGGLCMPYRRRLQFNRRLFKSQTMHCDPGWRAADCSELDMQPVDRNTGYNHTNITLPDFYREGAGNSSWGGHIVHDRDDPRSSISSSPRWTEAADCQAGDHSAPSSARSRVPAREDPTPSPRSSSVHSTTTQP